MSGVPASAGAPSGTSDHQDFTQELPRKLLPTRAKDGNRLVDTQVISRQEPPAGGLGTGMAGLEGLR